MNLHLQVLFDLDFVVGQGILGEEDEVLEWLIMERSGADEQVKPGAYFVFFWGGGAKT